MPDCIFCKIIKGEIPCYKVYEDNDFFAFLDINPVNPGHVLVIPKKHIRWVWDAENIGDYYRAVQKIAKALKKAFTANSVVSLVIGDEVPHAHVWLIPSIEGDGHKTAFNMITNISKKKKFSEQEMKAFQKRIVAAMKK